MKVFCFFFTKKKCLLSSLPRRRSGLVVGLFPIQHPSPGIEMQPGVEPIAPGAEAEEQIEGEAAMGLGVGGVHRARDQAGGRTTTSDDHRQSMTGMTGLPKRDPRSLVTGNRACHTGGEPARDRRRQISQFFQGNMSCVRYFWPVPPCAASRSPLLRWRGRPTVNSASGMPVMPANKPSGRAKDGAGGPSICATHAGNPATKIIFGGAAGQTSVKWSGRARSVSMNCAVAGCKKAFLF